MIDRRDFLSTGLATLAAPALAADWATGEVTHILPAASSSRFLIKLSLRSAHAKPPVLAADDVKLTGRRSDSAGRFWSFYFQNLKPGRQYRLRLTNSSGKPLCQEWPLQTFPPDDSSPGKFRLLIYTCAGGHDGLLHPDGQTKFLPIDIRQRLFRRALSFSPDAMIANGDHVYWDQQIRADGSRNGMPDMIEIAGRFNRFLPVLGTPNEEVLLRSVDRQIGQLYGTLFRSVPVHFTPDDHDYFENDEGRDDFISFPPDHFMIGLARATRRLYYPEHLPDAQRPPGLPGESAADTGMGLAESFGTLRYGKLAEVLQYDCRRYLTLKGPTGVFVPGQAEKWLLERTADESVTHLIHLPSTPMGWSAGKWGEWYPDFLDGQGTLGVTRAKPHWQTGWAAQHDRILKALSAQKRRAPFMVSGDLHAIGHGRIKKAGNLDLSDNPVTTMLSGPISTGPRGWPSSARNTPPKVPTRIVNEEPVPVFEEHGFLLVDFTPREMIVRMFRWNVKDGPEAIDRLEPFHEARLPRG